MKWYIPVKYEMGGYAWVHADSLEEAMGKKCFTDVTFDDVFEQYEISGTLEPDIGAYSFEEIIKFDGNAQNKSYPELINYDGDDSWEPSVHDYDTKRLLGMSADVLSSSKYKVSFMVGGCVYCCTVRAYNEFEAIGVFSRFNPRVPGALIVGIENVE